MLVLCVVSKDKKAKCRTIKTKDTSTDDVQSTREYKKIPPGTWMFVLRVLYSKDKSQSQDIQDKEVRIKWKKGTTKSWLGRDFPASVQTGLGAHQASCTMGTGSLSRMVKRPGRGVNHCSSSSAEVKERVELYVYSRLNLHGLL